MHGGIGCRDVLWKKCTEYVVLCASEPARKYQVLGGFVLVRNYKLVEPQ